MSEWMTFIQTLGVPVALLAGLCFGIYKATIYLADRLFDDKHGAVVVWNKNNEAFLNGVAERHEKQLAMCAHHGEAILKLQTEYNSPQDFSTVSTNQALATVIEAELVKIRALETLENGEKKRVEFTFFI